MADNKRISVGGQAVMEGVMMKVPARMALAVRKTDGSIFVEDKPLIPPEQQPAWKRLPFLRGCIALIDSLGQGSKTLMKSADIAGMSEEETYSRFELWLARKTGKRIEDIIMPVALVLGVAMAIGLFIALPTLLSSLLSGVIKNYILLNLAEGLIRIIIFLGYLAAISCMKDIRRVFMYHGAEHKLVFSYEKCGRPDIGVARGCSRLHPRCGTSFLLLIVLISITVFSFLGRFESIWLKMLTRIALIPVVAGISYEVLRLLARYENGFVRALRWPGVQLQRFTTCEPDDSMLEVAAAALARALDMDYEYNNTENSDAAPAGEPGAGGAVDAAPCDGDGCIGDTAE